MRDSVSEQKALDILKDIASKNTVSMLFNNAATMELTLHM